MKLPKIPIDFSKIASGEAPFDGKHYLLHYPSLDNSRVIEGYFNPKFRQWHVIGGTWMPNIPDYYSPMPEFEEVKS